MYLLSPTTTFTLHITSSPNTCLHTPYDAPLVNYYTCLYTPYDTTLVNYYTCLQTPYDSSLVNYYTCLHTPYDTSLVNYDTCLHSPYDTRDIHSPNYPGVSQTPGFSKYDKWEGKVYKQFLETNGESEFLTSVQKLFFPITS